MGDAADQSEGEVVSSQTGRPRGAGEDGPTVCEGGKSVVKVGWMESRSTTVEREAREGGGKGRKGDDG